MKNWTILIYANGNNDLEPEMHQAMLELERITVNGRINIVLQIGREKTELVTIMRSDIVMPPADHVSGVRRYELVCGRWVQVADLGQKNMADPNCLCQFVEDGMIQYPAERYMVILGGHGYQFVGAMPDYSQDAPYIMDISGMAEALKQACRSAGRQIDLLVADVCYFNFVEIIYEFAEQDNRGVQNILTYICDGPIGGMPYSQIAAQLAEIAVTNDLAEVICRLVTELTLDLVAIRLDFAQFQLIKQLFHNLADCYSKGKGESACGVNELLFTADPKCPWQRLAKNARASLETIIITYKRVTANNYGLLNILNTPCADEKFCALYTNLKFTHNNAWTSLVTNVKAASLELVQPAVLAPHVLAPEEVYAYIAIMNPLLPKEEKINRLRRLYAYKNWGRN